MANCEKCGIALDTVDVNVFARDGSDYWQTEIPLHLADDEACWVDVGRDWTGDELDEEEMIETIRCPNCKQYPFRDTEIQTYEIVRVVMFREKPNRPWRLNSGLKPQDESGRS